MTNRTLGDSLARGLIRRWEREQQGLRARLQSLNNANPHLSPRQHLNATLRTLKRLQATNPWILDVADQGKRQHRQVVTLCIELENGRAGVWLWSFRGDGCHGGQVRLTVSRHALQRLVQAGLRTPKALAWALGWIAAEARPEPLVDRVWHRFLLGNFDLICLVRGETLVTVLPFDSLDGANRVAMERATARIRAQQQQRQEVAA